MRSMLFLAVSCALSNLVPAALSAANDSVPHVVFVTGDEEYRSEESMPMLARILKRDFGYRVTVCYSLADDGTIAPNNASSIEGLEALESADLMVLFTRFRDLPDEQFRHFLNYVGSGRPIVGFRTATHAFQFKDPESPHRAWNETKIRELVGQKWITHHGHHGDGQQYLTEVTLADGAEEHPILRGVEPFSAYSWLYHVQGGGDTLAGDSRPLLTGRSLISSHAMKGDTARYPLTNPVAWTKTYTGQAGKTGRVFFTTLGHPYDFKDPSMRKLALNGILWALGREDAIAQQGADPTLAAPYEPNNSGFGDKFKAGRKPPKL